TRDPRPGPHGSPSPRPVSRLRTAPGTRVPCRRGRAARLAGTGRSARDPPVPSPRSRHTPPNVTKPHWTSSGQIHPKMASRRQALGVGCYSDTSFRPSWLLLPPLPAVTSDTAVRVISRHAKLRRRIERLLFQLPAGKNCPVLLAAW